MQDGANHSVSFQPDHSLESNLELTYSQVTAIIAATLRVLGPIPVAVSLQHPLLTETIQTQPLALPMALTLRRLAPLAQSHPPETHLAVASSYTAVLRGSRRSIITTTGSPSEM